MNRSVHAAHAKQTLSLDRLAFWATLHCLTGCAIGEVLGMTIGSALGWSNGSTVAVSVVLAFAFGYALTLRPLLGAGLGLGASLRLALASDTLSIATMEVVDNAIMLVVPGAMDAPIASTLFWGTLGASLVLAGAAAFPLNRWLVSRGRGHALVHAHHGSGHAAPAAEHADPHAGHAGHAAPDAPPAERACRARRR